MPMARTTSRNVLFIGNSFTARNDLPGLIAQLAAERGCALTSRLISAGGASLRRHWNAGSARHAIAEGGFDHVVLQEQSTLPLKNPQRMHESVRLFDEVIRAAGATTVLYLTWARQHAPESQDAITRAYLDIGRELHATVVPVGVAWKQVLARPPAPILHDRDGSHPSPAGTYLAACVFVHVLFGVDPRGLSGVGTRDELDRLQAAAVEAARMK